mgnify:CR=1 FL=1
MDLLLEPGGSGIFRLKIRKFSQPVRLDIPRSSKKNFLL